MKEINKDLANAKEKLDGRKAAWQNEKESVDTIQDIRMKMEQLEMEAARAERESDFEKVARIRYGELKEKEAQLKEAEEKLDEIPEDKRFTTEEVTANDIAEIVARWTGIPVQKMMQSEKDKLLHLEDFIDERLIGQEEVVKAVADAVSGSRAGMQDAIRPIG